MTKMKKLLPILILVALATSVLIPSCVFADDGEITFTGDIEDTEVRNVDAVYADARGEGTPSHSDNTSITSSVGQIVFGDFVVYRSYLYFDTSALSAGVNITGAILQLYVVSSDAKAGGQNFNFTIQSGMPTYPHRPFVGGDYNYTLYAGDGGGGNTTDMTTGAYNNITITELGWLNMTGYTKFVIRSDDDINNVVPVGAMSRFKIANYENGAGTTPNLIVFYETGWSVTTMDATYLTDQSARLNSYVVDDAGGSLDLRFQWDTDADVSDGTNTTWTAGFNTGESHSETVGGLAPNTQYWFRVQSRSGTVVAHGDTLSFTTLSTPMPPTDAHAYTEDDRIVLVWTRGYATESTLVRWKLGSYPTSTSDGTLLTLTEFGSASHEGLDYGTEYYYTLWGYTGANYTTPIYARITTSAGTDATAPPTTATPTFWLTTVDYTRYASMPLYSFINDFVNSLSANLNFGWTILGLIVSALAGVFVFFKSRDGKAAVMTIGGVMVALVLLRLLPGFMAVFAVLFFIGASKMSKVGQGGYAQ